MNSKRVDTAHSRTYTFDANGSITGDGSKLFGYNAEGRLAESDASGSIRQEYVWVEDTPVAVLQ